MNSKDFIPKDLEIGVDLDPRELLRWSRENGLTEVGKVMERINKACEERDFDYLRSLPFVRGIIARDR